METNAVLDLLDKFRIRTSTDCSELSKLSEKTVKVSGGLPTGGYLFLQLMISCWERYDVSITCCGIDKEVGADFCYDEATKQIPFQVISE